MSEQPLSQAQKLAAEQAKQNTKFGRDTVRAAQNQELLGRLRAATSGKTVAIEASEPSTTASALPGETERDRASRAVELGERNDNNGDPAWAIRNALKDLAAKERSKA